MVPGTSEVAAVADIAVHLALYVVDGTVPFAYGSRRMQDSWERDPIQIALGRAAIKRIDTNRRAGHYPLGIDSARSRYLGYLLVGMKSTCGDSR